MAQMKANIIPQSSLRKILIANPKKKPIKEPIKMTKKITSNIISKLGI